MLIMMDETLAGECKLHVEHNPKGRLLCTTKQTADIQSLPLFKSHYYHVSGQEPVTTTTTARPLRTDASASS